MMLSFYIENRGSSPYPESLEQISVLLGLVKAAGIGISAEAPRTFLFQHSEAIKNGGSEGVDHPTGPLTLAELEVFCSKVSFIWLDLEEIGAAGLRYQVADGYVYHLCWSNELDTTEVDRYIASVGGIRDDTFNSMVV